MRRGAIRLVSALALVLVLVAQSHGMTPAASEPTELRATLDRRITAFAGTAAIAAIVTRNGTTIVKSGGSTMTPPLDEHSLFQIGSVTKTFTATLLALMVLDGSVLLDDPVARYLPATVHVPSKDGKKITLLDLATQHSGLPRLPDNLKDGADPYATYSVDDMYAFLTGYALTRAPGTAFEYSNYGVALLGQALANRAETSYADLLARRVLVPLGMTETRLAMAGSSLDGLTQGHTTDGDGTPAWTFDAIAPAGAAISSIADLEKYARCNLGVGPLAEACLFAQRPRADFAGHRIGLAWWTDDGTRIVHHGGDTLGHHASIAIAPDHTTASIVLANGGLGVEDLAVYAIDPSTPVQEPPLSQAIDPALIDGYAGSYVAKDDPSVELAVRRVKDTLMIALTGQAFTRIYSTSQDRFASHVVDARFRFARDGNGKVTTIVLAQNGETVVFLRPGASLPSAEALSMFPTAITLDRATLQEYVGTYGNASGTYSVTLSATQLSVQRPAQSAFPIFASAKDAFFLKAVTATIDFERDAHGTVSGFTLRQGGYAIPARRLRPS